MTQTLSRQPLLERLCADLNSEGWNQSFKVWQVKGAADDEYLVLLDQFSEPPELRLAALAWQGRQPDDVTGLVLATEGWSYPPSFRKSFASLAELRTYWIVTPPADHPERIETRNVLLASRDATITSLLYYRDGTDSEWTSMAVPRNVQTDDPVIDAMRASLGLMAAP